MRLRIRYFGSALCLLVGCTSISSTMVNRLDNDLFVGNSNGDPTATCGARPFKGVPITVRVPTHLDVAIKETIWLNKDSQGRLFQYKVPKRHLFVEAGLIETDKVFTVDPKRPAAGTLTYNMVFGKADNTADNTQYFQSITNKLVDKTINDVNSSLTTLLPIIGKLSGSPAGKPGSGAPAVTDKNGTVLPVLSSMIAQNRVVAWKRFDLDSPDFESQVECFVEHHLNQCNSCRQYGLATGSVCPSDAMPIDVAAPSHPQ